MRIFPFFGAAVLSLALFQECSALLVLTVDDLATPDIDVIIVDDADGGIGTATSRGNSNTYDSDPRADFIAFGGNAGGFSASSIFGWVELLTGNGLAGGARDLVGYRGGTVEISMSVTGLTTPTRRMTFLSNLFCAKYRWLYNP